jgi:hypothetical protein
VIRDLPLPRDGVQFVARPRTFCQLQAARREFVLWPLDYFLSGLALTTSAVQNQSGHLV